MRGTDKLLEEVEGRALLRRQAEEALQVADHVAVALPAHDHPRVRAIQGLPVQVVEVPDAHLGMSSALRRGVAMLPRGIDAVLVLPADMPELTAPDLAAVIAGFRAVPRPTLQQATAADGTPGHPVLFPADCFPALLNLSGDQGARRVLDANAHRLRHVALPGSRAVTDLDTPEAWQAWRDRNQAPCAAE
ncbi:CTP:molybdopterin cytidylyltransferase [Salipiger mucosus DSM 16094]|uniref:CTP:molybdopterin cytidylyltransferase n=2 Tax=Salipiger mucosus TaxID=263378 RepID=S9QEK4_9RHOB|nr:CTP:molybdopterin cytidylyltransferase [Salipiger mucosus DSM 16094]